MCSGKRVRGSSATRKVPNVGLKPLAVASALLVVALAACTPTDDNEPTTPLPSIDFAAVEATLGPYPAESPWSQTDKEATWAVVADDLWAAAISRHPQLARPVVAAEREIDAGEIDTYLRPCLEGSGIDLGSYSALEWMPVAEGDYVAWYTCRVKFPLLSSAPPNDEQVGYLYDYFTQFVVPCLEANGSAIDSAPSRDTFVREWPNQDWFPEPTTSAPGTAEYASASAVCPSTPPGA